jgi:hypothetical protein
MNGRMEGLDTTTENLGRLGNITDITVVVSKGLQTEDIPNGKTGFPDHGRCAS